MSYYPEPDSHIRNKVKVVLYLSSYATEKELKHATGVDTSDLAAKKDFIALKAEVDKLDINKLTNVPTSLNNLKTKVDDLDVDKLKTVPVDLKKLSNVVDNEVVKNTKFSTLKAKVNNLEKKIPDATTLIHINQYNTDKQNLEKKIGDVDKKIPDTSGLVATTVLNTKINEVENKIPDTSSAVTTTVLNTKIREVKNKVPSNKLTAENFAARLTQTNLVSKTDFDNKLISFNRKITSNKAKYLEVLKNLNSLTTKDYNFFLGRMCFTSKDGSENIFVYQPTLDPLELKKDKGNDYILSWKSKGVYNSKLKSLYTAFLHSIKHS